MKLRYLLISALLLFNVACEEEDPPLQDSKSEVEVVVEQVTESLTAKGNLNTFIKAFESLEMSNEDIEEGITIFAPVDDALEANSFVSSKQARYTVSATDTTLTPEVLKDHIVKGIVKASDLSDGEKLTTLSGKQLEVEVDGDDVWVNGISLSGKDIATGEKHVVHTVAKLLTEVVALATIEVTVWNGILWSPDKPTGEPETGVTVSLYNSQEDYAQGEAAFTQETGAEGKAIFTDLEPGKLYYIVAKKDNLSNIFYRSAQVENGVFTGMFPDGLFQTQAEIDNYAVQADGKLGNFRWKDLNGDGMIDNSDRTTIPHKKAETVGSEIIQLEVIIGYDDNYKMGPVRNRETALQLLEDSYKALDKWQKTLVMADGMLSDDADCGNMTNWCEIDNFNFNSLNIKFTMLWQDGYKNIGQLNKLLRDVPGLSFKEKNEVIAQAKGLRAYIYLHLITYFGDIPLQTDLELTEDAALTSAQEVYEFILAELSGAKSVLPLEWPSDKHYQLTSGAVKVLLAKAALWKKDYQKVAEYTNEILQSGTYQLMQNDTLAFTDAKNAEIVWDFTFSLTSEFLTYFHGRSFCPAARFAEVYLMNAEAQFMLGNIQEGMMNLNLIRERMGMPPAISSDELSATWKAAMSREGSSFANLLRWETASEVLSAKGFSMQHALLPVPQFYIDNYPNLVQNPGY